MFKAPIFPMNSDTSIQCDWDVYWVIRTLEDEPRYIETIGKDEFGSGETEYGLMYNIHFAKVFKAKPKRTLQNFIRDTGIQAGFQQVPKQAYEEYKNYFDYFMGHRELTKDELAILKEEQYEYKMSHGVDYKYYHKLIGG